MDKRKVLALVAAALLVGAVVGGVGSASAAAAPPAATATAPAGLGLQLGAAFRAAGARMIDVLAKLTGLSTDEVYSQRQSGKSVADIAKAEGVDPDKVLDTTLAARKAVLDEKVAGGVLSTEARDAALARMSERMSERINSSESGPPSWARGGRGGAGRGMMGGQAAGCGACAGAQAPTQWSSEAPIRPRAGSPRGAGSQVESTSRRAPARLLNHGFDAGHGHEGPSQRDERCRSERGRPYRGRVVLVAHPASPEVRCAGGTERARLHLRA